MSQGVSLLSPIHILSCWRENKPRNPTLHHVSAFMAGCEVIHVDRPHVVMGKCRAYVNGHTKSRNELEYS